MKEESNPITNELGLLRLRVRRCGLMLSMPESALRLIKLIDTDNPTTSDLERAIQSDPDLVLSVLGSHIDNESPTTVREAVLRMGTRALRNIASTAALKNFYTTHDLRAFPSERYRRHSLAVGFLAKYLFARTFLHRQNEVGEWSADELYAAGIIHDLALPLIARAAPDTFSRVTFFAKRNGVTIDESFEHLYGEGTQVISTEILRQYSHAEGLISAISNIKTPWQAGEDQTFISCLTQADYLANTLFNCAVEEWIVDVKPIVGIADEFAMEEQETTLLRAALSRFLDARCIAA